MTSTPEALAPRRTCGERYTCCIALGITELKKWPGQHCKHLDGALGPLKRCSIYSTRPHACQRYNCAWIEGIGQDHQRPDKVGFLITPYASERSKNSTISATIMITDGSKCGTLEAGPLAEAIQTLIKINCNDIRVVNYKSNFVLHYFDGEIRKCKLHPSTDYEELMFEVQNPPIGRYQIFDNEAAAQEFLTKSKKP
jgi:Fe-S-cluster containining protein